MMSHTGLPHATSHSTGVSTGSFLTAHQYMIIVLLAPSVI